VVTNQAKKGRKSRLHRHPTMPAIKNAKREGWAQAPGLKRKRRGTSSAFLFMGRRLGPEGASEFLPRGKAATKVQCRFSTGFLEHRVGEGTKRYRKKNAAWGRSRKKKEVGGRREKQPSANIPNVLTCADKLKGAPSQSKAS